MGGVIEFGCKRSLPFSCLHFIPVQTAVPLRGLLQPETGTSLRSECLVRKAVPLPPSTDFRAPKSLFPRWITRWQRQIFDHFWHHPSFWWANWWAWLGFTILGLIGHLAVYPTVEAMLLFTPAQLALGYTLSSGLRLLFRTPSRREPLAVETALYVVLGGAAAALVHTTIVQLSMTRLGWLSPAWSPETIFFLRLKMLWLVYMGWGVGYFWLQAELAARSEARMAERARQEAKNIELRMLRAQLDPHFLFNSLNGIAAEIPSHPAAAGEMVCELADYLRYSLDHRNQAIAPLAAEIDSMTAYLRIETARFGEHLQVVIEIEKDCRSRLVPCFLLQPLVENAVKHGYEHTTGRLHLWLEAKEVNGDLILEVANSGELPPPEERHEGVGLSTLRRRLEIHYPGRHRFRLQQNEGIVHAVLELQGDPVFA
jgi:two-component system LytT family sensor kinase